MNTDFVKRTFSKPVTVGFIMLLLGLLVGVAAEKYSVRIRERTTKGPTANAHSLSGVTSQKPAPDTLFPDVDAVWDPFRKMRELQAEMDKMFQSPLSCFSSSPLMDSFGDGVESPLSMDVQDLKDRYEIKAFLPDGKSSEAKVKLEGNRLEVTVTHRPPGDSACTNAPSAGTEWGRYTQVVELSGTLRSEKMKVAEKDHALLITIPKVQRG